MSSSLRRVLTILAIWMTAILLVLPFCLKQNSWSEWANPYFFLIEQRAHLQTHRLPTLFLNNNVNGMGYPQFVFYAGPTISVLAWLSLVVEPWLVFNFSIVLGFVLLWFGTFWLVCSPRYPQYLSMGLATCVALTPYVVTNVYGRGAWAEHLGSGAAVFLVGSLFRRSDRSTFAYGLWPAFGSFVLFGTHNISVLVGMCFGLMVLSVRFSWLVDNRKLFVSRLISGVLGVGLTAPILFPNLQFSSSTVISTWRIHRTSEAFDSLRVIFSPFLYFPAEQQESNRLVYGDDATIRLFSQTNSLLFFFVSGASLILLVRTWKSWNKAIDRPRCISVLLTVSWIALLLFLMTQTWVWDSAPSVFGAVQFPYRLHPYLSVLIVLLAAESMELRPFTNPGKKFGAMTFTNILVVVILAFFQIATAERTSPPGFEKAERSTVENGSYPPVYRVDTAPPVQFRMTGGGDALSAENMLYFGDDGSVLSTLETEYKVRTSRLSSVPVVLLSVGSEKSGSAIGLSRESDGVCSFVVDRWGIPPERIEMRCERDFHFTLSFVRSSGQLILSHGSDLKHVFDRITGVDGTSVILDEVVDFSTMVVDDSDSVSTLSEVQKLPSIAEGRYNTNVVATPFTSLRNVQAAFRNSSGFWTIETTDKNPSWQVRQPLMLSIGLVVAFISLATLSAYAVWASRRYLVRRRTPGIED